MAKDDLNAVLADNLAALMQANGINSAPKLAKKSGVSQKSISNIQSSRHDPQISTVARLAQALGTQAYQMLTPSVDKKILAVFLAWEKTDSRGRELIQAAAEAAVKISDGQRTTDSAGLVKR